MNRNTLVEVDLELIPAQVNCKQVSYPGTISPRVAQHYAEIR
jgi:hypothetical protein